MRPNLSVIVCTHNPRPDFIERVLAALQVQTLPQNEWELIIIDNASAKALAGVIDLSWHPNGQHVREDELGLTAARLRGIRESQAEVLIFVDDDNVLDRTFLSTALETGNRYEFLGAWGGTVRPEFDEPPPRWTERFWAYLAIREIKSAMWSNVEAAWSALPCGAGLCVRRTVARKYLEDVAADGRRRVLDRRGQSLISGGDTDLVLTAQKLGLGWGNFPELGLTHLIPRSRLTEDYLLRLVEGVAASSTFMSAIRSVNAAGGDRPRVWKQALTWTKLFVLQGARTARFYWASVRGEREGFRMISRTISEP